MFILLCITSEIRTNSPTAWLDAALPHPRAERRAIQRLRRKHKLPFLH